MNNSNMTEKLIKDLILNIKMEHKKAKLNAKPIKWCMSRVCLLQVKSEYR